MTVPAKLARDGSRRGGARPNSGPKPKAIKTLQMALVSAPIGPGVPATLENKATAADLAFSLFVKAMQDESQDIVLRLDCAREIMNRAWGKPTERKEVGGLNGEPNPIKAYVGFDPDEV
jgi:hypothetical protein